MDSEIRLITPTDPEGSEAHKDGKATVEAGQKFYQLTHDYLVHSLRDWLTRKQKETRRGRAELRLAGRSASWHAKPETRLLPSVWEYLNIRLLTDNKKWTSPQRKMVGQATRLYGTRGGIVAAAFIILTLCGLSVARRIDEKRQADHADFLVRQLLAAEISQVSGIVQELADYRRWADPMLQHEDAQSDEGSNSKLSSQKLHLDLVLLPVDDGKVAQLRDELPLVSPSEFPVIRDALLPGWPGSAENESPDGRSHDPTGAKCGGAHLARG